MLITISKIEQLHAKLSLPILLYGKCPKILYIKVAKKMAYANSADPDQTAPEGAV